jgi:3-oxoadipate enol-lactonase
MALMRIGDIELNVRQWGEGEPLVMVHGLGTNSGFWLEQVRSFAISYHVIALDLRGFGRSEKPKGRENYTIELMAQDVLGVCQALGLRAVNFLGCSMGGFIGQELALKAPELCKRIVLGHTACEFAIPMDVMAARLNALNETTMDDYAALVVQQALAQPPDPIIEEWLAEMIADNDREAYMHVLAGTLANFDLSKKIHAISCPTLVISGSDDRVLPPAGGRKIADLIRGSEFHLIDDVGHTRSLINS